jgi:hypothetical protein
MLRRTARYLIGVESDVFMSRINDKAFIDQRIAKVGKSESVTQLSHEDLQRFTASVSSAEQLFNHRDGLKPTGTVGPDGREVGSAALEPTRYGDWEKHGRCYDF